MPNKKSPGHGLTAAIFAVLIAVVLSLAGEPRALAQAQQGTAPQLVTPQSQGSTGSTLELPALQRRQSGETQTIPQMAPQKGQELVLPSRQLRSQAGYKQVTVTVTDQSGRYVTGLQKGDFQLYLDGQQRPVQFFRQDLNTPVSIGILVDTSGSMQPKLQQARAAIAEFLRDLNPKDDVFLFAFSSRPFLLQPFTTNHYLVMSRLALLHAFGQTALFDTILDGLLMVQHGRYDKKALLVVTDGMDNASQASLQQVIAEARRMGVLVYSIGIGNPNSPSMPALGIGPFVFGGDIDQVDARTLKTLSTETGAKTFIMREMGDGQAMRDACANISRELREQYTLGFLASDPASAGYRSLRVEVPSHPGVKVRVRKGVTVGPGTESASAAPSP
jgi:Ca-activated chloride channel homolog